MFFRAGWTGAANTKARAGSHSERATNTQGQVGRPVGIFHSPGGKAWAQAAGGLGVLSVHSQRGIQHSLQEGKNGITAGSN